MNRSGRGIVTLARIITNEAGTYIAMSKSEFAELAARVSEINEELRINPIEVAVSTASFIRPKREFLSEFDYEELIPLASRAEVRIAAEEQVKRIEK